MCQCSIGGSLATSESANSPRLLSAFLGPLACRLCSKAPGGHGRHSPAFARQLLRVTRDSPSRGSTGSTWLGIGFPLGFGGLYQPIAPNLAADSSTDCHNAGSDTDRSELKCEDSCYQQEWRKYSTDQRSNGLEHFAPPQRGEPSRYWPSTRIIGHWLPLGKWSPSCRFHLVDTHLIVKFFSSGRLELQLQDIAW